MKKTVSKIGMIVVSCSLFLMMISGCVSNPTHEVTIVADPSAPAWNAFDYRIDEDSLSITPADDQYMIAVNIENLGLCYAGGPYGWSSSTGRSTWAEWNFTSAVSQVTDISIRVEDGAPGPGAKYRFELDSVYLGDAEITAYNAWYLATVHSVSIAAGKHTLFLGTYQGDLYPDYNLDYIMVGEDRIEAENYNRTGGNDPNTDFQGVSVYPNNISVEFWDGNPQQGGVLLSEQKVGIAQTVADFGHECPGATCITKYIPSNSIFIAAYLWNPTPGNHTIYVLVDPANQLQETNELNNNATLSITIP